MTFRIVTKRTKTSTQWHPKGEKKTRIKAHFTDLVEGFDEAGREEDLGGQDTKLNLRLYTYIGNVEAK